MDSLLERADRLLGNNEVTTEQPTMETKTKDPNLPRSENIGDNRDIESNIADLRDFVAFLKETVPKSDGAKKDKESNTFNCDPPRRTEKNTAEIESNTADLRDFVAFLKETVPMSDAAKKDKKSNAINSDPPNESHSKKHLDKKNDDHGIDLEKLAELVANRLKENPNRAREPSGISSHNIPRKSSVTPVKEDPFQSRKPQSEFFAILQQKDDNREAENKLAEQIKSEDLGYLIGPQLEKLSEQLKKIQLCSEVARIQSQTLMERGQMPDISTEKTKQIIQLESQLCQLLKKNDSKLQF